MIKRDQNLLSLLYLNQISGRNYDVRRTASGLRLFLNGDDFGEADFEVIRCMAFIYGYLNNLTAIYNNKKEVNFE